jgi:Dolichyl-phosphate-mannose-protein mannosyltransferase
MSDAAEKKHLWQSPVAIFIVALLLRLVAVRLFYNSTWNDYEDHLWFGFETGRIARSIAEGHGYGNPLSVPTGPTAWLTPIYPYLVAAIFKLLGVYSKSSALVMLSLNSLFSALICFPLFHAAKRSFGHSVAVTACWLWTLFPYFIYIPAGFVWDTCLGALLVATLFLFALKLKDQPGSGKSWFGFGVLGGFCALTNASTLTLCPILAAWAIYPLWRTPKAPQESRTPHSPRTPQWLSPAILAAAGLVLVLLPWQIRNYRTFHTSVPLRSPFWVAFWVGNDGDTSSWMDLNVHPSTSAEEQATFARLGEIPYMQEKRRESLAFLAQHPGLYVVLCFRRFIYVWTGFWNLDPSNLQDEFHGFANVYLTLSLTATMLLGLWRAWRNSSALGDGAISSSSSREALLPYALVLFFYPLVFYLSSPTIRYRHVIDPEVVVLSALGLRSLLGSSSLKKSSSIPNASPNV